MTTLQTLEMALKDLEDANNTAYAEFSIDNLYGETITKLRQQIALEKMAENERELGIQMQPDEPAAWMYEFGTDHCDAVTPVRWYKNVTSLEKPDPEKSLVRNVVPLYTRPQPAAQWVGLDWLPEHKCGLHLSDIEDKLGVELSYAQVIDYLIHYYRKHNRPATSWQKQTPTQD